MTTQRTRKPKLARRGPGSDRGQVNDAVHAPVPLDEVLPVVLRLRPMLNLTDEQLLKLSALNSDLRLERSAEGELVIMPPAGWESGVENLDVASQLRVWARQDGTGIAADSSAGYRLPNGAVRGPDASWVARARLEQITPEEKRGFLPLCPDFVIELRSPSDRLPVVQAKMHEYMANGAELGWLIDPAQRRVYIYRPNAPVEQRDHPMTVSGDPVLAGFVLDLREIWEPRL